MSWLQAPDSGISLQERFGSVGICGGYGEFNPGSSLPCHLHKYDESITIIKGEAICEVAGKRYLLSDCDTGFVPEGVHTVF